MKSFTVASIMIVMSAFGMAKLAQAYTIPGPIDVGVLDSISFTKHLDNSGDGNEISWVNGVLGTSFTADSFFKINVLDGDSRIRSVNESPNDIYAYDLKYNGGYFFLKLGNITLEGPKDSKLPEMPTHFLYMNNSQNSWAVFSLSNIREYLEKSLGNTGFSVRSFDIGKISHIGEVDAPVPEPTTMFLFGSGILGVAAFVRRQKKK